MAFIHSLITIAAQAVEENSDSLTFAEVLANIPRDPAAIVLYLVVGLSIGLVIWAGRDRKPKSPEVEP